MSTGISISSINRIKELAEEKRYAEALEILDTQNLDKSINPQFLRISGEIFRENKRYYDSRRILLKSHQMSPQGIRILFELIQLHLELGHFSIAEKYYEQYMFYSPAEDPQKDYVEYIMKKATGTDVKELASILVPILERMPEDKWNFEAILLFDKLGRKDKALEESQYILENFKDSVYVQSVIAYIDDTLDVDQYFYVYPKEEQIDDEEIFGDLIAKEEEILQADYLRMYPPEARIMVEVEDKDFVDSKQVKEKKSKKKKKNGKTDGSTSDSVSGTDSEESLMPTEEVAERITDDKEEPDENTVKKTREAALEKILEKKVDREKIRESAKQIAKAVKEIDTEKTKNQVKSVAESVKDNVKKATSVFGEAVGVSTSQESVAQDEQVHDADYSEEQIMDGIIEEVLEPPKKIIGQVVTNEELDSLIPESLEAMSEEEIAIAELKKKKLSEEELLNDEVSSDADQAVEKDSEVSLDSVEQMKKVSVEKTLDSQADILNEKQEKEAISADAATKASYNELKARYIANQKKEDEQPKESLGFIKVVQSDVDKAMKEETPDIADLLHQMINNKEYYSGEDSAQFESDGSYQNHGFEVEDCDFEAYKDDEVTEVTRNSITSDTEKEMEDRFSVEVIYAQETIVNFNEIIPEDITGDSQAEQDIVEYKEVSQDKLIVESAKNTVVMPIAESFEEDVKISDGVVEEFALEAENKAIVEAAQESDAEAEKGVIVKAVQESDTEAEEEVIIKAVQESDVEAEKEAKVEEVQESDAEAEKEAKVEAVQESDAEAEKEAKVEEVQESDAEAEKEAKVEAVQESDAEAEKEAKIEAVQESVVEKEIVVENMTETIENESTNYTDKSYTLNRESLRIRILLSDNMVRKLLDLKESRW